MKVSQVLQSKGSSVVTATTGASVAELADLLAKHNIGALVIVDEAGEIAGILSERDVVRRFAKQGAACASLTAGDLMTRDVVTCNSHNVLTDLMITMTNNRIRHLPVVDDGKLSGIMTIGDVVKHRLSELEREAEEMKRYIAG